MSRQTMIRRFVAANLAALVAAGSATPLLADGPVGGSHTYRPPARVTRPVARPPQPVTYAPLPAADQVLRIDLTSGPGVRNLTLPVGQSAIVELPVDVRDMLVTQPLIADAVLRNSRRIYIVGQAVGVTDAVFFDATGRKILSLQVRVEQDLSTLNSVLRQVLPDAQIKAQPLNGGLILSGLVMNAADSEKASRIAAQFVSTPEKVLNMLSVAGKDQVMLEVRIVEVQRTVIKQMGVSTDLLFNDGFKTYGLGRQNTFGVNGSQLGGADLCYGRNNIKSTTNTDTRTVTSNVSNSNVANRSSNATTSESLSRQEVTLFDATGTPVTLASDGAITVTRTTANGATTANGTTTSSTNALSNVLEGVATTVYNTATGNDLGACLEAFERVGLVRTLAEPNLTVLSGEAGKFLAGGEFPVPVAADNTGKITVEFKPYGVGLGYTPVVLSGGRISLKLSTEVSELSSLGAYSLTTGTSTLVVPGLSVRRAETTVEMPSGGSLMIAGLLQQTTKQTIDSLPGMTSMPVLGSLFRSRDYLNGETELVVIITPYIVDPTRPQNLQTPADGLQIAGDLSTTLMGRLNKTVKAPAGANAGRAYQGPVGYVIE